LYYGWHDGSFYFASELKAIVEYEPKKLEVNLTAISQYLSYRFIPSPNTIWKDCYKLPPAHYLILSSEDFQKPTHASPPEEYWSFTYQKTKMSPQEAVEKTDKLLRMSVDTHLRSDVPVGSFLSGGYDSSALVYYMTQHDQRPNTFSIGFDNWKESEHQYAQSVAHHLNVPFHKTIVGSEQLGLLDKLVYHYDEPIADISIIPTYMVSQLASRYNKAVFSGEGADEIFGGYWWQKAITHIPGWQVWMQKIRGRLGLKPDYFVV
jgi:asparagine synthase (glutamine-hydrolysing)